MNPMPSGEWFDAPLVAPNDAMGVHNGRAAMASLTPEKGQQT
jgi:hypothetical protein